MATLFYRNIETDEWKPLVVPTVGVTTHSALTDRNRDDHPQYLLKAGGTMTGPLTIDTAAGTPGLSVRDLDGVATIKTLGPTLTLAQSAGSGVVRVTNLSVPTAASDAANKGYVDGVTGAALDTRFIKKTGDTMTGDLKVTGPLTAEVGIDGAAGQNRGVRIYSAGKGRWFIGADNGTEARAGNTGSDFTVSRYDNAGVFIDRPLTIDRSTGHVEMKSATFSGPVEVAGSIKATGSIEVDGVAQGVWQDFAPVFKQGTTTLACTVNRARMCRIGNTIMGEVGVIFTDVGSDNKQLTFVPPVAYASGTTGIPIGQALFDPAGADNFPCFVYRHSTASVGIIFVRADVSTGDYVMQAVAVNDRLTLSFSYECDPAL